LLANSDLLAAAGIRVLATSVVIASSPGWAAYAEHKREKFLTLVTALRKLGFEMALPDALRADERQAA